VDWFMGLAPIVQTLLATCFTWSVTALGAGIVFFLKDINQRALDGMMGSAAGVMVAASFWSLLEPAIAMAEGSNQPAWLPAAFGFLAGGGFLWAVDRILPHVHVGFSMEEAEGIKTHWQRGTLLVLAITLHNIPEGLAVGVAFGSLTTGLPGASLAGALSLAVGIGIQNFPEGAAVSAPLRRDGMSRIRSFLYRQLSGFVEPIAGVIGAAAVIAAHALLPYALAFAAGAMIYVVVEELIPESQLDKNTHIATMGFMAGFALMMVLDVAFG